MRVGIEASNLRAGGGITHLVEILGAADPARDSFDEVTVWGPQATLDRLPRRPWLHLDEPMLLRAGMLNRARWIRGGVSAAAARQCDILFAPGGSYLGTFHPTVTMSRNMIPFDRVALRRFGWSRVRFRLELLRIVQRHSFRRADGMIFLTATARSIVGQASGKLRGMSTVIPHGVSSSFFAAPRPQRSIGDASAERPLRLLYVSIVDVYKHQAELAEAVGTLHREGTPISLDLVGPSYAPELRRLRAVLNRVDPAGAFIHYLGGRSYPDLPSTYRNADIFVFASSCENLPNVLLEAMAAGLPVACSDRSVMPEVLGDAGLYFDPTDPVSAASTLRRLIGDVDLRSRLASAAHQRAQQYSWTRCAAATFSFLRDVLDRFHRSS